MRWRFTPQHGLFVIFFVWVVTAVLLAIWMVDDQDLKAMDWGKVSLFFAAVLTLCCLCISDESRKAIGLGWSVVAIIASAAGGSSAVMWRGDYFLIALGFFVLSTVTGVCIFRYTGRNEPEPAKPWARRANRFRDLMS